jgi:hypothetical protein
MNGGATSRVSVLARVQVEHEVDERPRQSRAGPEQEREARACDLRRTLEVEDAECGTEIPVRLGLEVEGPRLAHPADLGLSSALRPTGTEAWGRFGTVRRIACRSVSRVSRSASSCLIRCPRCRWLRRPTMRRSPAASPCHLFARGVLLALERLDLHDAGATLVLEGSQLGQHLVGIEAAVLQTLADDLRTCTDECGVEHAEILY